MLYEELESEALLEAYLISGEVDIPENGRYLSTRVGDQQG
jgi:hypothetical protein